MKKLKVTIVAALSVSANMLACAQDSTQAPIETVNDGGVEVVREAQATAPVEPPKKVKDAYEEIKSWIKGKNGWKLKWDKKKKRIIKIVKEEFDCSDLSNLKNVMVQRDAAVKRAVLQAKADFIMYLKQEVDAEDIVEMLGGNAAGISVEAKAAVEAQATAFKAKAMKQSSMAAFMAEMPLFGAICIRQSESWNGRRYQVAIAFVWSPKLERAARAVLTGDKVVCKPKPEGMDIEEWLESVNPALMSGPIQYVDKDGTRWFLGISASSADEDLDAVTLRMNRSIADMSAKQMVVFSLWGDVKAYEMMRQELSSVSVGNMTEVEAAQWAESKMSQVVKGLPVRGMEKLYGEEIEYPVTGKRIYVSIYGINQESANENLKIEALNFATRAEIERVKTLERGRAAANKALVRDATNDPADYVKGYNSQSKLHQDESNARKKGRHMQIEETSPTRANRKAVKGVFNGGADADDDF